MALPEQENGPEREGPVIRDKRRIDPETGELREPEGAEAPSAEARPEAGQERPAEASSDEEVAAARQEAAERTADLQRLQAEYANYRKRVDRDRAAVREQALAQVLSEFLPVLDDIGRAREHNELTGGFKSVGESLEAIVAKLGLARYAEVGDEFDPTVHEALTMVPSPDVSAPTVIEVFQPGYVVGERVIRPARVVVAGPAEAEPAVPAEEPQEQVEERAAEAGPAEAGEEGGTEDGEPNGTSNDAERA